MTSVTIFCDESGFSGNSLLDEEQPLFVYASVAIESDYAQNLVQRVTQQRGLQGTELKASNLLKHGRGRAAINDVLKEVAAKSRIVLWDKTYALATLIYEYLFERRTDGPCLHILHVSPAGSQERSRCSSR